jgi:hypothetical protein
MHDRIDGYCIVDEPENIPIVGTYSNKCTRKNALFNVLLHLEEIGDLLDDAAQNDVTIRHIEYNEKYVQPFCDDDDVNSGSKHQD